MDLSQVAVVILNYNGKKFLEKFLANTIACSGNAQVIVADNASSDDSLACLREKFPEAQVISNPSNFGYARGYNEALKKVKAKYYVLLNNDVEVTPSWLQPMYTLLEKNTGIAACAPKLLAYGNKKEFEYAGAGGGLIDKYCYPFCRGRIFNTLEKDSGQYNDETEIFWASGACLFVRSDSFHMVCGFDNDYFAHMEEIDLCWRMKNLGGKIFYCGKSTVYHVGGGTLHKISARKTFLNFRNNLITLTKNYPGPFLLPKIFYRMCLDGVAATKFLIDGSFAHFVAVIKAHFSFYAHLPSTLRKRKEQRSLNGFTPSTSCIYNKNLVFEYFLREKHEYGKLDRNSFLK